MSDKIMRAVATRTSGEVYIGVVGAVRSGKSTFIRHFMEKKVLPYIRDDKLAEKVRDELPQSAEGKTIMTVFQSATAVVAVESKPVPTAAVKDMKSAKRKGMPDICPAYPDNQYKNENQ